MSGRDMSGRLRARAIEMNRQNVPRDKIARALNRSRSTIDGYLRKDRSAAVREAQPAGTHQASGDGGELVPPPPEQMQHTYHGGLLTPADDKSMASLIPSIRAAIDHPALDNLSDSTISVLIYNALTDSGIDTDSAANRMLDEISSTEPQRAARALAADALRGDRALLGARDLDWLMDDSSEDIRVRLNAMVHPAASVQSLKDRLRHARKAGETETAEALREVLDGISRSEPAMTTETFCLQAKADFDSATGEIAAEQIRMEQTGSTWFRSCGLAGECDTASRDLAALDASHYDSVHDVLVILTRQKDNVSDKLYFQNYLRQEYPDYGKDTSENGDEALRRYSQTYIHLREKYAMLTATRAIL